MEEEGANVPPYISKGTLALARHQAQREGSDPCCCGDGQESGSSFPLILRQNDRTSFPLIMEPFVLSAAAAAK